MKFRKIVRGYNNKSKVLNIIADYRNIDDDPDVFDWRAEMQLIHDTEVAIDENIGVIQAVNTFERKDGTSFPDWLKIRMHLDICSRVEGI